MCFRTSRYGGEDCVAASVTLASRSGAGLREVVSHTAAWSDIGCTTQLPFVCKRVRSQGLPAPKRRVYMLTSSLLVFPPEEDGTEMLVTHAEGQKLCRSLGVRLAPSCTRRPGR